jgi:hypothetical protein
LTQIGIFWFENKTIWQPWREEILESRFFPFRPIAAQKNFSDFLHWLPAEAGLPDLS